MRSKENPESAGGTKVYGRTIKIPEWMGGPNTIAGDLFREPLPDTAAIGQGLTKRGPGSQTQSAAPRPGRKR
jgi:hypothetical protein